MITVTFTIRNSGTVAGHEVRLTSEIVILILKSVQIPQLYTAPPASTQSAPRNLRGFDSIYLTPGQSKVVTIQLSRYDLSIWNVVTQRWEVPTGSSGISVGASSRDIRLTSSLTI